MTTVFIAGSISINRLHAKVQERINKIVSSELNVVVGDADGADASIQECLHKYGAKKVTVFCSGESPQNNVAGWPIQRVSSKARVGSRAYFTAKDIEMARNSDYGLMIWDCKSTGTLSNVIELLREKKKSVVFINKSNDFITIPDKSGLDCLLTFMSHQARAKAEQKISLSTKISTIEQEQFSLRTSTNGHFATAPNVGSTAAGNVEDNLANTESLRLRSVLMSALEEHISRNHLSLAEAANVFGVSQDRFSDFVRGKIGLFGLDDLVKMAEMVGLRIEISVRGGVSG